MSINEMKTRLEQEGLLKAHVGTSLKSYISGEDILVNNELDNVVDVFGIYKEDEEFVVFITDSERGIPQYIDYFSTESEACEELLDIISSYEKIYKESHN